MGAIVSNAQDFSRFFSALMSGRLVSEASLAEMRRAVAADGALGEAGLGLFSTELSCGHFWGHGGGILDYGTLVSASEDGDRVAVLSFQGDFPATPPDESLLLCDAS